MSKVFLTRIDSLLGNKVTLSGEEVCIGRGSILGCDDKRISRKHGLLQVSNDGSITLVSMHSNPCFYKEQNMQTYTVLVKGQSKVLHPGDEFALLPDSFRYRVGIATSGPDSGPPAEAEITNGVAGNVTPSKRRRTLPGWLTSLPAGDAGAGSGSRSSVTTSRKRKASTGGGIDGDGEAETRVKQEPSAVSGSPSSAVEENGEARVKREPPEVSGSPSPSSTVEENGEARVKQEHPVAISPSPPSSPVGRDEEAESPQKQDGANGNKDGYEAEYGEASGTSSRREPCPYGATCYRRNPAHRTEESHPGDPDYPVLPQCPYGAACYRRNPQHRKDYGHAGPPATPPSPQAATAASPTKRTRRGPTTKDGDDSEDDYDYNDPFLNDASSDDYKPTSSEDSDDDEEEDEDEESQERRRMLREAKKFTKKKKK